MMDETKIARHDSLPTVFTSEQLVTKFESIATDIIHGRVRRRDLLTIARDEHSHFSAYSDLAPIGSCSQSELEHAFSDFVRSITGEEQDQILEIALKEPDKRKPNNYYDKLESTYATLREDIRLGVEILVDDRGIISATWSLEGPEERTIPKLGTIFSKH